MSRKALYYLNFLKEPYRKLAIKNCKKIGILNSNIKVTELEYFMYNTDNINIAGLVFILDVALFHNKFKNFKKFLNIVNNPEKYMLKLKQNYKTLNYKL